MTLSQTIVPTNPLLLALRNLSHSRDRGTVMASRRVTRVMLFKNILNGIIPSKPKKLRLTILRRRNDRRRLAPMEEALPIPTAARRQNVSTVKRHRPRELRRILKPISKKSI
jgi:hypothetical protein